MKNLQNKTTTRFKTSKKLKKRKKNGTMPHRLKTN